MVIEIKNEIDGLYVCIGIVGERISELHGKN